MEPQEPDVPQQSDEAAESSKLPFFEELASNTDSDLGSESEGQQSLMDRYLKGKQDGFARKLIWLVNELSIDKNDPFFLVLLYLEKYELVIEQAPKKIDLVFRKNIKLQEQFYQKIRVNLEEAQRAAMIQAESEVLAFANSLLKKVERKESRQFFRSVLPACGVILGAIGVGVGLGVLVPSYLQGGYASENSPLTRAQANALEWAMSEEGALARNLIEWNKDYLGSGSCEKDTQKLEVDMIYNNRSAKRGYCLLWVKPVDKRGLN